jgi:crotonobetainyl-CoA:carnitine CoA-transferase CaiB-like acyl-CoA transferase
MQGPLDGVLIADFTHGVAGPLATMILGDLGADVVKIERPGRGDPTRYMNVSQRFLGEIPDAGGDYFLAINRNKRSVTIDLSSEEGRDLALDLVARADVVAQSFRPGVMERLGLGYHDAQRRNAGIVYASLSAYGREGPLAGQPGMDVGVQARSGVMSITGYPGGDPVKPGASLADMAGGSHLATGLLAALFHRERTGEGQELHVSLLDATMFMLINYSVAVLDGDATIEPMGSGHPQLVPFQAFPTADGHIVIATGTNRLFRDLCDVLEMPELASDDRFKSNSERVQHREELVTIISELTGCAETGTWLERLTARGIPASPVSDLTTAFHDPQLAANKMVVDVDHPSAGTIHLLGVPYKLEGSPCEIRRPPPCLGEHTDQVMRELLQLDDSSIADLRGKRVI